MLSRIGTLATSVLHAWAVPLPARGQRRRAGAAATFRGARRPHGGRGGRGAAAGAEARGRATRPAVAPDAAGPAEQEAPEPVVLFEGESELNGVIQIHEVPHAEAVPPEIRGSRLLYMGTPSRLLGVYRPLGDDYPLTYAYWDYFATLPVLLEDGPVAIYGWGGGTPARLLAEVYDPPPRLEAWELDPRVLDACRLGMGLEEIERAARVRVRAGNPLGATPAPAPAGGAPAEGADGGAPEGAGGAAGEGGAEAGSSRPPAAPGGKFAGVIVDLFIDGKLLPQLMSEDAWRAIRSRLADPETGRVMAHVGPASDGEGRLVPATVVALNAMARAFDGELHYIDPPEGSQLDVMALTGPLPSKDAWAEAVGPLLAPYTVDWEPWEVLAVTAADVGLEELEAQINAARGAGAQVQGPQGPMQQQQQWQEEGQEEEEQLLQQQQQQQQQQQGQQGRGRRGWGESWAGGAAAGGGGAAGGGRGRRRPVVDQRR